jgi:hypothetical protein
MAVGAAPGAQQVTLNCTSPSAWKRLALVAYRISERVSVQCCFDLGKGIELVGEGAHAATFRETRAVSGGKSLARILPLLSFRSGARRQSGMKFDDFQLLTVVRGNPVAFAIFAEPPSVSMMSAAVFMDQRYDKRSVNASE